ncbi:MAG: HEAT repeat domain-containing protein, partial [Planctomycetes bacterium]|nr:HEAT repeat domain-containing protein [Planctomycetota bacterium]
MNQRPDTVDDLRGPRTRAAGPSLRGAAGRCAAALLGCALCAFAQSPEASGIERLVATDADRELASKDPVTRGEAALIVASAGRVAHEARLLELAADPANAARHRATLALGLLATPNAIQHLEGQLRTVQQRSSEDGMVAAYALGLVPTGRVETSIARTLPLFRRGSWKRQHDTLLALLRAMAAQPDRPELGALRLLFDDDANRAPDVRAAMLELLLPIDRSIEPRELQRTLRRGSQAERRAVMRWIANRPAEANGGWIDEFVQFAERDDDPEVRASALLGLARARHLPALEIAARALRSSSARESTTAVEAMLAIGGASMRGALEQHLLDERDPKRLGPLLRGFQAPPSKRLVDRAAEVARSASAPGHARVAAAELIARSDGKRAAPLLRDLFRDLDEPELLVRVARALERVEEQPTALSRLLERPVALAQHRDRWYSLLVAGHAEAQRQVLATLQDPKATAD